MVEKPVTTPKIGMRVRFSKLAIKDGIARHRHEIGEIVGISRNRKCFYVLWDDRVSTGSSIHSSYLEAA